MSRKVVQKFYYVSLFLFLFVFISCPFVSANNLRIENISLEERSRADDTVVVEFDISWDNSWKDDINHDAVWVFLKACEGGTNEVPPDCTSVGWEHGDLEKAGLNPAGTDPGTNKSVDIWVPPDKIGAFIRRNSSGSGAFSSTNVQLTMDYGAFGAADTDTIQVRVFGYEMTYIPEGSFSAGDGNNANNEKGSNSSFKTYCSGASNYDCDVTTTGSDIGDPTPWSIASEVEIVTTETSTGYYYDSSEDGNESTDGETFVISGGFPKGYMPFYYMKYELTQGQYRDFLNTLTEDQQQLRTGSSVASDPPSTRTVIPAAGRWAMTGAGTGAMLSRNSLKVQSYPGVGGEPATFACDYDDDDQPDEFNDGEWIAMNYLSWMDIAAVADWAGLRPATELEYEKAARGPNTPVHMEYAWGDSTYTAADTPVLNEGQSNEVASTTGHGLMNFADGSEDLSAPFRVGFAATVSTSRAQSGAGYYGNMELTANQKESIISVGNAEGRKFYGTHGDGTLTIESTFEGNATNLFWPGISANTEEGINALAEGMGLRGGGTGSAVENDSSGSGAGAISDRRSAAQYSYYTVRHSALSARYARTALSMVTNSPGTMTNVDNGGTAWLAIPQASALDGSDAYAPLPAVAASDYLYGSNFGFSLPDNATVKGIMVHITRMEDTSADQIIDDHLFLVLADGSSGAEDKANTAIDINHPEYYWTTNVANYTHYGDPYDLWSETLTPTDINDSDFGTKIACLNMDGLIDYDCNVDHVSMTVYYEDN